MFPFNFSCINQSMLSQNPMDSLNLLWNQQAEKMKADSIMYMTPTFNFNGGWAFPEFGTYGNSLLNPMLAIQQTMNSFQNGNWMGGMNGGFGNFNFGNMFSNTPWNSTFPGFGGGSNGTSGGVSNEYTALKNLIVKYKELGTKDNSLSPEVLDRINKALNKSGKPEEKMDALKEVYKTLNKNKLEKALLALDENKNALYTAGYDLKTLDTDENTKLKKDLNSLETDINNKKGDKLAEIAGNESNSQILKIISCWNSEHSSDSERGIIRLVAKNLPEAESERETHKAGVNYLVMSLINKTEDLKSEVDGNFTNLDKAKDELKDALTKAQSEFNETNLMTLAGKFDTLYAMLRIMEAERIRNKISTKYDFLNKIASNDKDFVNDDLIVKATKEDLKSEGIDVSNIKTDSMPKQEQEEFTDIDERYDTAEERIDALVEDEELKKTAKDGVYMTTASTANNPAHFYMEKDDKIIELKNVTAIDKNGNCTMVDGSKKTLAQAEASSEEVTAQDIVDYNNTIERVDQLVKDGTLVKWTQFNWLKGEKLFKSKGLKENGRSQYFVIRNNKLVEIDCESLSAEGKAKFSDGTEKEFSKLEDGDFREISDSEIVTTNKKVEADRKKAVEQENKLNQAVIEKANILVKNGLLKETNCKDPKVYYSENSKKHYIVKNGKLYELTNTLQAYGNGNVRITGNNVISAKNAEAKETSIEALTKNASQSGTQLGRDFADKVMGNSSSQEITQAVSILYDNVNVYNIRSFIKAYHEEEGWFTDNICEQIFTENDFQDCKHKSIKRIIQLVLAYCDKEHLNTSSNAYKKLKEKLSTISDNDNEEQKITLTESDCQNIDNWILSVLHITD